VTGLKIRVSVVQIRPRAPLNQAALSGRFFYWFRVAELTTVRPEQSEGNGPAKRMSGKSAMLCPRFMLCGTTA